MTGADDPIVVVGGGASTHALVAAHADAGGEREIVVLSADERLPYFRPHLTKEYLAGSVGDDDLDLDDAAWYAARGASVRLDAPVDGIDAATRTVSTAAGPVAYSSLVLATGSSATGLPLPGGDHPSLLTIRSAADARRVVAAVGDGAPVLVVGTGFIGCEAATSLRARGLDVTMAGQEPGPQSERLGRPAADLIEGWLRDTGIALRLAVEVASIEVRDGSVLTHFTDGVTVESGHVLVAGGAKPNTDLAASIGLPADDGVDADASMRTSIDGVFATGDIAHAFNAAAGRPLRVEHWGDAEAMGNAAGITLAGHRGEWNSVPGFWSTIAGQEIQYAAWGDGWDQLSVDASRDGDQERLCVWYGKGGLLVGALTYRRDDAYELARSLLSAATPFEDFVAGVASPS